MKKLFTLTIFLLIALISTNVFAVSTTMEIVEDNVCTIKLNDSSIFEKRIISSDLEKHQVTLQLKITNNEEIIVPTGELMLVIDSSDSMDDIISGTTTRKDVVLNSANKLVEGLLKANSTSLKIGVVSFSSNTEKDPNTGFTIEGTIADAQKVSDLSNNLSTLTSKISAIEGVGSRTDLDSGLQLAKSCFSSDDTNKYIIVLTDGVPNLSVGNSDCVTYNGLTTTINNTKATLESLSNLNVITMLTGISNENATMVSTGTNTYTYGQVINQVFGTMENPTVGKFYYIQDNEIEKTITNDIYNDLLPVSHSLKDITIVDYFPQYIVDNFEMTYVDGIDISNVSSKIDLETNSITWKIAELAPGETAVIQYNLKLKDEFDEKIIGEILDTNQKVDINYKDFDDEIKTKTSDVTPKIRLNRVPDVAPVPLPAAGLKNLILICVVGITVLSIFFAYKSRKIK